ncbi:MAG: polysaccharide biosynthesis C-terminal domain-containing protein [Clostridiales bacterium]|nr:polysaccharide biosynthesis C-terminal domain-containing protein [Clostridiales bacterium]
MFWQSPYAAVVASSDKAVSTILALAPTVLFSSMAASGRGFAEGHMNMLPTSVSQIIEAVFKMVFGLLFAKLAMSGLYNTYLDTGSVLGIHCINETQALSAIYPVTSAAAIGGVTIGSLFSWIYCSSYVSIKYGSLYVPVNKYKITPCMKEIMVFSAPIILSTLIQSLSEFFDNSSVQYCLSLCNPQMLKAAYSECIKINNTTDSDIITYIYGLFSSAHDIKNLVPGFTMALGVAAVPAISAAFAANDKYRLASLINSIFKYTSIISFAGGFLISLTSKYVLEILYGSSNYDIVLGCADLVKFYGFTMILYSLSGAAVFAVQSIGCASKSIPMFLISAVIRVALNYVFVSDYRLNIYGAAFSDAVAYIIILISNMYILKKYSGIKYSVSKIIVKPLICSLGAYFTAGAVYSSLFNFESGLAAFAVLSVIYTVLLTILIVLSKTIEFSELKVLQYCKKTA